MRSCGLCGYVWFVPVSAFLWPFQHCSNDESFCSEFRFRFMVDWVSVFCCTVPFILAMHSISNVGDVLNVSACNCFVQICCKCTKKKLKALLTHTWILYGIMCELFIAIFQRDLQKRKRQPRIMNYFKMWNIKNSVRIAQSVFILSKATPSHSFSFLSLVFFVYLECRFL